MSASSVLMFTGIVKGIQVIDKYKSELYICVIFQSQFTKLYTNKFTKFSRHNTYSSSTDIFTFWILHEVVKILMCQHDCHKKI